MKPTADDALRAIRAKCMECSGRVRSLVEQCSCHECPLYPYRSCRAMGIQQTKKSELRGQINVFELLRQQ